MLSIYPYFLTQSFFFFVRLFVLLFYMNDRFCLYRADDSLFFYDATIIEEVRALQSVVKQYTFSLRASLPNLEEMFFKLSKVCPFLKYIYIYIYQILFSLLYFFFFFSFFFYFSLFIFFLVHDNKYSIYIYIYIYKLCVSHYFCHFYLFIQLVSFGREED